MKTLEYIGKGSFNEPAYRDNDGNIWFDINGSGEINLYKSSNNELDGEPDYPITGDYKIIKPAPKESLYKFNYMMLSVLKSNCDYFCGYGRRHLKILINDSIADHINEMKRLWAIFPESEKPKWLTMEQINEYEREMLYRTGNIYIDGWSTLETAEEARRR